MILRFSKNQSNCVRRWRCGQRLGIAPGDPEWLIEKLLRVTFREVPESLLQPWHVSWPVVSTRRSSRVMTSCSRAWLFAVTTPRVCSPLASTGRLRGSSFGTSLMYPSWCNCRGSDAGIVFRHGKKPSANGNRSGIGRRTGISQRSSPATISISCWTVTGSLSLTRVHARVPVRTDVGSSGRSSPLSELREDRHRAGGRRGRRTRTRHPHAKPECRAQEQGPGAALGA